MVTLADRLDENQARFVQLIPRSLRVARQQIEAEGAATPIAEEARLRALNGLRYALHRPDAWAEIRDLLLAMATKMEMAGYREEWLYYLEAGLTQSQQVGDRLAEAALYFHCGHLQRLLSHYDKAQALLQTSATIYAELGDKPGQARALNQLAYLAWQQNQLDKVASLAHQAMGLLGEDELERAMSLSALGLAAVEQHRWRDAEEYHRAALVLRTAHGNRRQRAWSVQNLGYAFRGQGEYEAAIACLEEAITALAELHDLANCAVAQMNLGIVYFLQSELIKALETYAVAEFTFRRIGDEWNLAKVLVNQGVAYLTLRDWQRAENVLTASANLFQQSTHLSEYLNALDGVGICYLEQGFVDKALVIFEAIAAQLPQIQGTHHYHGLTKVINDQLERARAEKAALSTKSNNNRTPNG